MCYMVYLASDTQLKTIPWNEKSPAFHVEEVTADHLVRMVLNKKYVYYIGSHENCGCGFNYVLADNDPQASEIESIAQFREYLSDATKDQTVHVYIRWAGTENLPPEQEFKVDVSHFAPGTWKFDEGNFFEVSHE